MFTLSEYVYSMLYLSSFPRKNFKLIVDIPYLIQISWGILEHSSSYIVVGESLQEVNLVRYL